MENYLIDIDHNVDMKNITAEKTSATVDGDVRVIIKSGTSKQQVHLALQAISSVIVSDQINLD